MSRTILVATEKPFAPAAVDAIKESINNADGYELKLLEKYTDKAELLEAVKEAVSLTPKLSVTVNLTK